MKKLITLTIAICISMALILNVNAKQTVAVSRITTKSTKVTVQLPKKAKWTVTVYRFKKYVAKKRGKKKAVWKKLKKLTVKSKVTTVTIPISKQKKDKKIKLVAKSGKKKFTVKTTVKKYVAKKGDKKENPTVIVPDNNNNTSSDGVKFDFDAYWEDYYLRDLNNDYYKDFGFKPFSQVNNYLLVDKDSDGNIIEYGFIVGSTVHSVVWYEPEKYKVIMNQVKEIIKSLNINNSMTEQEKAFRICRYIVENTPVSDSSAYIYECLIEHKARCMGLSQSYSLLCRYVGIESDCIYSDILMHEWNIIKIGSWWYYIDVFGERSFKLKSGMFFLQSFYEQGSDMEKSNSCFKTNNFTKKHPYNDISYIQQCQKDGTPYMTWQELMALPY